MNKFLIVIRPLMIIVFAYLSVPSKTLANTSTLAESVYAAPAVYLSDQVIKNRLENLSSVIDINYTNEVGRRIRDYTINYRVAGERILGRVDLFFPLFEQEIAKRNLPEELKYIAIVESNLDPMAYSHAGAAGLWQFIKSTGRMQGLKIDKYIDERRDPEKSTKAALDYLSDLYTQFGDWTLAIAAYNCGPGNVKKAIRRGNSTDFWKIRKHLPNETQKYVPRIIAAMYLMQYYHAHDLIPDRVDEDLKYVEKINDGISHNFHTLSKELDISYQLIRDLNPQFATNNFPQNNGTLSLVIPASKYDRYLELYHPEEYAEILKEREEMELWVQESKRLARITERKVDTMEPLLSMIATQVKPLNTRSRIEPLFYFAT
jgi:membrane-bound lytic murein transglycosylase D